MQNKNAAGTHDFPFLAARGLNVYLYMKLCDGAWCGASIMQEKRTFKYIFCRAGKQV